MSASPVQRKTHWWLAALLLGQLILMSVNARHPSSEQSVFRTWMMSVFSPLVKVGDAVISKIGGGFSGLSELRRAKSENEELRQEVERLTIALNESREKAAQYDVIRNTYGLPSLLQYRQVAANVIARDTSLWFNRLTIDRGTLDGVKRDMPVATTTGIVGRVISVGPNFAQVQVITDSNAGVGVMLQSTRAMGVLKGLNNARCEIKNIPSTEEVPEGETVVTNGLDRIYPKGLIVGTTERVENDGSTPWKRIVVNPAAQVDRVENVLVLLIDAKELKLEETIK
ncbi:MAG: rod shape-determining protein MreC [Acidobacteria bacterium]|nr:rod shape-determining protein MreC [Acidobacteriota bacterium]